MAIKLDDLINETPHNIRYEVGKGYTVKPIGHWGNNAVCTIIHSPKTELRLSKSGFASLNYLGSYSELEFIYIGIVQINDYGGDIIPGKIKTVQTVLFSQPIPERSEYIQLEGENAILVLRRSGGRGSLYSGLVDTGPTFFYTDKERDAAIQQAAEHVINRTNELRLTSTPKEERHIGRIVKFMNGQLR